MKAEKLQANYIQHIIGWEELLRRLNSIKQKSQYEHAGQHGNAASAAAVSQVL